MSIIDWKAFDEQFGGGVQRPVIYDDAYVSAPRSDYAPSVSGITFGRNGGGGGSNALQSNISNLQNKFSSVGLPVPQPVDTRSNFQKFLNFIDTPRSWVVNPLYEAVTGKQVADGEHKFVTDILDQSNFFKNHNVLSGTLGFLGDIALDPLTYLTFGAGSTLKAGTKATQLAAKAVAEREGLNLGKNVNIFEDLGKNVANDLRQKYYQPIGGEYGPRLLDPEIEQAALNREFTVNNEIANAGKAARERAQNALLNVDIPFTNKTWQFGTKPEFLKIQDIPVGELGKMQVERALSRVGLEDPQLQSKFLQTKYGVTDSSQLTRQMFDHFMENIRNVKAPETSTWSKIRMPESSLNLGVQDILREASTFNTPTRNMKQIVSWLNKNIDPALLPVEIKAGQLPSKEVLQDLFKQHATLNRLGEILHEKNFPLDELLRRGGGKDRTVEGVLDNILKTNLGKETPFTSKIKDFAPVNKGRKLDSISPDNLAKGMLDFQQDMGGVSKLGSKLKNNMFNPRTLRSEDEFVNHQANAKVDAENRIFGNNKRADIMMKDLRKLSKGLSPEDVAKIPYLLEKSHAKFNLQDPTQLARFMGPNKSQLEQVVNKFSDILHLIGQEDKTAGTISSLIKDYFPHIREITEERLAEMVRKYANDPELMQMLGKSANNRFGQRRTGFIKLSQADKYLDDLATKMAKETDPDKVAELEQKIQDVSQMFERDPYVAVEKRIHASIRANAMKEMYDTFKKNGVVQEGGKAKPSSAFEFVTSSDAKNKYGLNMPKGMYIHKEVQQALEKSKDLFTDKGVRSFVDKLSSITNIWKSVVTTYVPSHHLFNFIGDAFNAGLAGVGVSNYKRAAEMVAGKGDRALYQKALDKGVIGHGWMSETSVAVESKDMFSNLERMFRHNPVAEKIMQPADAMNDMFRLALFDKVMRQTNNADIAAQMVRKYLFNYRELTDADKAARVVAPFWSWAKNNIPLQVQKLLQQPRYASTYHKIKETLTSDEPNAMPNWAKDEYMQIGQTAFNPRLPIQDLNKSPAELAFGLINPIPKAAIELYQNKQFYNGQPIDRTKVDGLDYNSSELQKYLLSQLGAGGKIADAFNGAEHPVRNMFFGKFQEFKPEDVKTQNDYAYRDLLQAMVKRLEQDGTLHKQDHSSQKSPLVKALVGR